MVSTSISNTKDEVIIKINKNDFSEAFVQNIIEKINLEKLANKSKLSEPNIYSLQKEIKKSWNEDESKYYKGSENS